MTDPTEPITEARVRLKKLAASMLVRKERLEEELKMLEAEQARVVQELDLIAAASPAEPDVGIEPTGRALDPELAAIRAELAAKVDAKREELEQAEADLSGALRQFDDLAKVKTQTERDVLRAVVAGATSRDPFSRDPADVALANVREHIGELGARVRLNDELAGVSAVDAPAAPVVREDPEAKARAILAELKAKKRGASPAASSTSGDAVGSGPDANGPAPAPKKKRTL